MTRAAVVLAGAMLVIVAWAICREQHRAAVAAPASWARHPDDLSPYGPTRG